MKILLKYKGAVKYVSIHAPSDLTISHVSDETHRKFAEYCLETMIKIAPQIDCKRVVFHGFYHVTDISNAVEVASLRGKAFSKCLESIKRLDRVAREFGVKMCLENINACVQFDRLYYLIFSASPYDLVETADEVNSDFFRFCFDAAHAKNFCNFISQSQEMRALYDIQELSVKDFLRIITKKVDIIHLSDAKGSVASIKTDNLPLGEGEIDFKELFEELVKNRFDGAIVLETNETNMNNAVNMVAGRKHVNGILSSLALNEKLSRVE